MFEGLSWEKLFLLLVFALFILGPERLPEAAARLGQAVRKIREFAADSQQQLRDEVGPEIDRLRKPLEDLRESGTLNHRQVITRQLFDDAPDPPGLRDPGRPAATTSRVRSGRTPFDTEAT